MNCGKDFLSDNFHGKFSRFPLNHHQDGSIELAQAKDTIRTAAIAQLLRRDRAMLAIALVLDVAFHAGRAATVSANDIAERLGSARRGLEPLLQALTRSGVLESVRGPRGGYRLGRAPRGIRLADIAAAIAAEPEPDETKSGETKSGEIKSGEIGPGALQAKVIDPLWSELSQALAERLGALSVDDLLRRAAAAGLHRAPADPPNWVI
jgi:Rrf2 family transcriptional regulator, iron-sulfur cluster assembly transcription factor